MQKAHLYEAIFLANQGIDQTVRGLARLKKSAGIGEELYGDTLATLEHTALRSMCNSSRTWSKPRSEMQCAMSSEKTASYNVGGRSMQEILLALARRIRSERQR